MGGVLQKSLPGMLRLPKQYPAVPATTWLPRPAACESLIRPPVPVVAPLNGETPVINNTLLGHHKK